MSLCASPVDSPARVLIRIRLSDFLTGQFWPVFAEVLLLCFFAYDLRFWISAVVGQDDDRYWFRIGISARNWVFRLLALPPTRLRLQPEYLRQYIAILRFSE